MIKFGIVSYNIYCNFTNYGSALQSWALFTTVNQLGIGKWEALLVDYCPKVHLDKEPLNPIKNMWDQDEESIHECQLSLPAIRENFYKFDTFYNTRFTKSKGKYNYSNFEDLPNIEHVDGFICGSDTIFCIDEFKGFDDGYYANFDCMKNGYAISYAASFGDSHFDKESYQILEDRLRNFKAIGIREQKFLPYVKDHVHVPCAKTIDPTLLLTAKDYDIIAAPRLIQEKYILLYARRYNKNMFEFAEKYAKNYGYKIVDISLRASNEGKHIMYYKAGVEEFLSLIKYAEFVVTNSFHGLIFSVQYKRPFVVFSREQADSKIGELLSLFGLQQHQFFTGDEHIPTTIDYNNVHKRIEIARKDSIKFLYSTLNNYHK